MLNQAISEFLGCMVLAFFNGILRIQVPEGFFLIALLNFFLITAFTASSKGYSSSYFNPILTIVQLLIGQETLIIAVFTIIFQIIGSLTGGFIIYQLHEKTDQYQKEYYGEPLMTSQEKILSAFLEGFSLFLLVLVYNLIIKSERSPKQTQSISMASVYFICICCFGYQSGGCINLTTLIGPSIMSNNFQDWGYYIYGQFIGGIVSGLFYQLLLKKRDDLFGHQDEEEEEYKIKND